MVKEMTVGQYTAEAPHLPGVVLSGDMVRVDCDEAGVFVMMEEPEYKIMKQSFEMVLAMSAAGMIPEAFLKKYGELLDKNEG